MSGLLFLTSDDFKISRGTKGNILTTCIPGVSLILFYSTQCEHCKNLIPIFKKLPGTVGGCQFGMINVSNNKQCILMSRETIAPISFVPYIGPHQASEIGRFVFEVTQKIQNKQPFAKEEVKEDPRGGIPAYTIGKPLYGDDEVCYLEFSTAYNKGDGPSLVMRQQRK